MPFLILRTDKIKTMGQFASVCAHHMRKRPTPNADPERECRILAGSGEPYTDFKRIIVDKGIRLRKNGVLGIEVLLTASPEHFRPGDPTRYGHFEPERLEPFTEAALGWLRKHFGEENLLSAALHLDEATPHIQAMIVPVDTTPKKRGKRVRLNARRWLGGEEKMKAMQTNAARAFEHLGLERGIEGSEATHVTIREYYANHTVSGHYVPPPVEAPPLLLSQSKREEWASERTDRLHEEWKKATAELEVSANQARILNRRLKETQETARRKSVEVRELADRLRDIPLADVFDQYGWHQKSGDAAKFIGPDGGGISTNGPLWNHWQAGQGGRGAIDLVMHLEELHTGIRPGFKRSLAILADRFGVEAASRSLAANAEGVAEVIVADRAFEKPQPVGANWAHVRHYLADVRGLEPAELDHLHAQGYLYADARRNAVFWSGGQLAELRGTGSRQWRGLARGSRRMVEGGFSFQAAEVFDRVVLVESAIDALSYFQLHGPGSYLIQSTSGVLSESELLDGYLAAGLDVVCAYDNDEAGHRAFENMHAAITRELPPPGCKDWNEALSAAGALGGEEAEDMEMCLVESEGPEM